MWPIDFARGGHARRYHARDWLLLLNTAVHRVKFKSILILRPYLRVYSNNTKHIKHCMIHWMIHCWGIIFKEQCSCACILNCWLLQDSFNPTQVVKGIIQHPKNYSNNQQSIKKGRCQQLYWQQHPLTVKKHYAVRTHSMLNEGWERLSRFFALEKYACTFNAISSLHLHVHSNSQMKSSLPFLQGRGHAKSHLSRLISFSQANSWIKLCCGSFWLPWIQTNT